MVTYDVVVDNPSTESATMTNSADVALAAEGGNNPSPVSATTLTVATSAPVESSREINLSKTLKFITQLNITDFILVYEFIVDSGNSDTSITNIQITDDLTELEADGAIITSSGVEITDAFSSGGLANSNFDGDGETKLLAGVPSSGASLDASGGVDTSASLEVTVAMTKPINTSIPSNTALATGDNGVSDVSDSDGVEADGNKDSDTTNDPATALTLDPDGDYFVNGAESTTADRDNDGIVDSQDFDPQGYFYCQENGAILSGGQVQVSGPASVTMIENGAPGYYQWFVTTPGTYTMTYTSPIGATPSTSRNPSGVLDPTGNPNPYSIGSSEYGATGVIADFTAGANPYYLVFEIEAGDPWIINNNIPFINCSTLPVTGTDIYLYIIIGLVLLTGGGISQYLNRNLKLYI